MTRCRCVGTRHTCGIQAVQAPTVVVVGQGGPRGLQGTKGAQGTTGAQGVGGVSGTQGVQGIQGVSASLQDIADAIAASGLNSSDNVIEGVVNQYFTIGRVSYIHTQGVSSDTWVINHNLGFYPNLTIQDSAGTIYEGEIVYTDLNNLTVTFSASFAGNAYLS